MRKSPRLLFLAFAFLASPQLRAQSRADSLMPVRGFCIAAPSAKQLDWFVAFIHDELVGRGTVSGEPERLKTTTPPLENSQAACFNAEAKRLGVIN